MRARACAVLAAALGDDDRHHECVELFTRPDLARRRLLVPGTVVAEVGYRLARNAGAHVESLFLQALADGDLEPVDLQPRDYRRAAELVQIYADLPLGTTDATVIALTTDHPAAQLRLRHQERRPSSY